MPLRSAISSMIPIRASGLPNFASMPMVSAFVIRPRSYSSMVRATALPADMVSSPSSSQTWFAFTIAPKSEMPQFGPNRPTVSNSGRARAPAYGPSFTTHILPHATVHR